MNPCPHCGAVPSGELFGYSVVMHTKDCPLCPQPFVKTDTPYIMCTLVIPRFACPFCLCFGDREKELEHDLDCPANPLTN